MLQVSLDTSFLITFADPGRANHAHAIRAAALFRAIREDNAQPAEDRRPIIINDLKILAQAEEENIPVILTEDRNTMSRLAERLRQRSQVNVRVLLLTEGFTPGRLETLAQDEFRCHLAPHNACLISPFSKPNGLTCTTRRAKPRRWRIPMRGRRASTRGAGWK